MFVKKLKYLILPNYHLYEKYKGNAYKVFDDDTYTWKEIPQFSGYWNGIDRRTIHNHKSLTRLLKSVVEDTTLNPCDFNKEKLFLYSNLYYQMKMGETIFVSYECEM